MFSALYITSITKAGEFFIENVLKGKNRLNGKVDAKTIAAAEKLAESGRPVGP